MGLNVVLIGLAAVSGPAAMQDRSSPPTFAGNPAEFFGVDNYPAEARLAQQQGRVVAEIDVGVDGRPTRCVVTSGVTPSLDARTCELAMTKVQYVPARDAKGKPTAGKIALPVRWQLEEGSVAVDAGPVQLFRNVLAYDLDTMGRVTRCTILPPSKAAGTPCQPDAIGVKMSPPVLAKGVPVRGRLTITSIGMIESAGPE